MNEKDKKQISKFLSLVLRHQPDYIDLHLNDNGWADINELIEKSIGSNVSKNTSGLEVELSFTPGSITKNWLLSGFILVISVVSASTFKVNVTFAKLGTIGLGLYPVTLDKFIIFLAV